MTRFSPGNCCDEERCEGLCTGDSELPECMLVRFRGFKNEPCDPRDCNDLGEEGGFTLKYDRTVNGYCVFVGNVCVCSNITTYFNPNAEFWIAPTDPDDADIQLIVDHLGIFRLHERDDPQPWDPASITCNELDDSYFLRMDIVEWFPGHPCQATQLDQSVDLHVLINFYTPSRPPALVDCEANVLCPPLECNVCDSDPGSSTLPEEFDVDLGLGGLTNAFECEACDLVSGVFQLDHAPGIMGARECSWLFYDPSWCRRCKHCLGCNAPLDVEPLQSLGIHARLLTDFTAPLGFRNKWRVFVSMNERDGTEANCAIPGPDNDCVDPGCVTYKYYELGGISDDVICSGYPMTIPVALSDPLGGPAEAYGNHPDSSTCGGTLPDSIILNRTDNL